MRILAGQDTSEVGDVRHAGAKAMLLEQHKIAPGQTLFR